jgi:AsmA-like C-terminal region
LKDAKLDQYHGIAGTIHAQQQFSGTLQELSVTGQASLADFEVRTAHHPVTFSTQFEVLVDATKGEAELRTLRGKFRQTVASVHGTVAHSPQLGRRETSLDFDIRGRAEDLLWLFNNDAGPPMIGVADCSGHVRVTKFGPGFLKNLELKGQFAVNGGHFQKETQAKANELSARAQGKKPKNSEEAPEVTVGTLTGEVTVQGGVAHRSNLFFEVPGARARMQGDYNFLKHQIDLHGDLWTDAQISQDTSGIKSVLLKPLDPLSAGSMREREFRW